MRLALHVLIVSTVLLAGRLEAQSKVADALASRFHKMLGVASFHRGGTLSLADAGDWGGLGTLDSNQFGVWRWSRGGRGSKCVASTLPTKSKR